jgi:hypothetical protein
MRTPEQLAAFAHLRALAAPLRLRVTADPEGWPIIPGRLWAIPGVRRHQTGDQEMRAPFPAEALAQVAGVIRARTRRRPNTGSFRRPGTR